MGVHQFLGVLPVMPVMGFPPFLGFPSGGKMPRKPWTGTFLGWKS